MSTPIYLYKGPEFGEKNDCLQELKNKTKSQFAEVEFKTFFAFENSVYDVMLFLSNGSLFSDARFAVLKNAEVIKKAEEIQKIKDWADSCGHQKKNDSVLVLITDENFVDSKLEKIVPKENVKMFWEMFENRKLQWVQDYFRKNGFTITNDAAQSILSLVENNTEALRTECSRFFMVFDSSHVIDCDDVDKILAHNREETPFSLFDAITDTSFTNQKRFEKSLEIMHKLIQTSEPIAMIAGLSYSFRQLKKWKLLCDNGNPGDIELKKNGFSSKKAQEQYRKCGNLWNLKQIQHIMALLSSTDMQIRANGKAMQEMLLDTMIYQIVMKNGNKLLEYAPENI